MAWPEPRHADGAISMQAMSASEQNARSHEAGQVDFFGSSALARPLPP